MRRFAPLIGPAVAAGLIGIVGCSNKPPPPPLAVAGTVTYRGEPLAGGLVVFAPDAERGNDGPPLTATVGADGRYALRPADGEALRRAGTGWRSPRGRGKRTACRRPTGRIRGRRRSYRNPTLSGQARPSRPGEQWFATLNCRTDLPRARRGGNRNNSDY